MDNKVDKLSLFWNPQEKWKHAKTFIYTQPDPEVFEPQFDFYQ